MAASEGLSLPVLLSRVLGQLAADLESAAGVGPTVPSLAVWSNVVRCVAAAGPDGLEERDLAPAARISSRLATAAVTGAARRSWITAEVPRSGKNRHLQLAPAGHAAAQLWPSTLTTAREPWQQSPLRMVLEELVSRLPFELPHFPASYGTADPSAIGGPYMQGRERKDDLPAHGTDWRPVRRADGDTVSALPLTALLSQALMAFTIDYEDRFPWPLANTLTVLSYLDAGPRRLNDVPGDHGIKGNGKTLVERHLVAAVTRDDKDPRTKLVALTDRGQAVMQHHPDRLKVTEAAWREQFGNGTISALRDALAPVAETAQGQPDYVSAPLHLG